MNWGVRVGGGGGHAPTIQARVEDGVVVIWRHVGMGGVELLEDGALTCVSRPSPGPRRRPRSYGERPTRAWTDIPVRVRVLSARSGELFKSGRSRQ